MPVNASMGANGCDTHVVRGGQAGGGVYKLPGGASPQMRASPTVAVAARQEGARTQAAPRTHRKTTDSTVAREDTGARYVCS